MNTHKKWSDIALGTGTAGLSGHCPSGLPVRRFIGTALVALMLVGCSTGPQSMGGGGTPGGVATGGMSAQSKVRVGQSFLRSGNYQSALNLFTEAAQQAPGQPEPLIGLGEAFLAMGDAGSSAEYFRRAYALDSSNLSTLSGLARAYIVNRQPAEAAALLESARDEGVEINAPMMNALGIAYDLLGAHGQARDAYAEGLVMTPGDPSLTNNLALSHAVMGDFETAVSLLQDNLNNPLSQEDARENLALIYALSGQVNAAVQVASTVLSPEAVRTNTAFYSRLSELSSTDRARAVFLGELPKITDAPRQAQKAVPEPPRRRAEEEPQVKEALAIADAAMATAEEGSAPVTTPQAPETDKPALALEPDSAKPEVPDGPTSAPEPDTSRGFPENETVRPVPEAADQAPVPTQVPQAAEDEATGPSDGQEAGEATSLASTVDPLEDEAPVASDTAPEDGEARPEPAQPSKTEDAVSAGAEKTMPTEPEQAAEADSVQPSLDAVLTPLAEPETTGPVRPYRIQLGSFRRESGTRRGWQELTDQFPDLLDTLTPVVQIIDLDDGSVFHRLLIDAIPGYSRAIAICDALKVRKISCVVTEADQTVIPLSELGGNDDTAADQPADGAAGPGQEGPADEQASKDEPEGNDENLEIDADGGQQP